MPRSSMWVTPITFTTKICRGSTHHPLVRLPEDWRGLRNCCTYCVIPSQRGPYRSRPVEALVAEAERLVKGGVRELILASQDITRYGSDMDDNSSLAGLIRACSDR